MKRRFLSECYHSAKGQVLLQQEADFLQRSITVSCKQTILQIGGLGWEHKFIDGSLYQRFVVVDPGDFQASGDVKMILSELSVLPVFSSSVDMVIMPHSLEFEVNQHQALREIERILKPEGKLIIVNFNPWSYWVRYHYLLAYGREDPLMRHFIRRSKMLDWLQLLNFEVGSVVGFKLKASGLYSRRYKRSPVVISYAVKAIKRRYNIIPLTPVRAISPKFAMAGVVGSPDRFNHE